MGNCGSTSSPSTGPPRARPARSPRRCSTRSRWRVSPEEAGASFCCLAPPRRATCCVRAGSCPSPKARPEAGSRSASTRRPARRLAFPSTGPTMVPASFGQRAVRRAVSTDGSPVSSRSTRAASILVRAQGASPSARRPRDPAGLRALLVHGMGEPAAPAGGRRVGHRGAGEPRGQRPGGRHRPHPPGPLRSCRDSRGPGGGANRSRASSRF